MNELNNKSGKVVTFYSFKGGVGRTMSLVNVACLLAKNRKKVLLIDWDLEAPGLHSFFKDNINNERLGLIDFVLESIKIHDTTTEIEEKIIGEFVGQNIDNFITKNVLGENAFNLDMITAGKFDGEYSSKLNSVNWIEFYKESPFFFRIFAEVLESKYDYILIDSRTGLSDTGGICTMLMPQILVLVFALNDQNIKGVVDMARQSIEYRFDSNDLRNLNVLPLPSRIDDNQKADDLQFWINRYSSEFEDVFKQAYLLDDCSLSPYFNKAKIPYKPEHAYGEKIPVLTESTKNDLFISYHYQQFTNLLLENIPTWEILSEEQLEENLKNANDAFKEGLKYISKADFKDAYLNIKKAKSIAPNNHFWYFNCAESLAAIAWNEKIGKKMDFLYEKSFELYQQAIEIKPAFYEALHNWGSNLANLAKTKEGKEAEDLYSCAFDKYQRAIGIKQNFYEAFNNWGADLGNLAKIKEGKEAEDLYLQAFDKYQQAIDIRPDKYETLFNWGTELGNLAKIKEGKEAEDLYYQACDKLQRAIDIKPDKHEALDNWGTCLGYLAHMKEGTEAEYLFQQAFDKFQRAIEYGADSYNFSCILALKGETQKAFEYLEVSLAKREIDAAFVQRDEDWKEYFKDDEFLKLLKKYE